MKEDMEAQKRAKAEAASKAKEEERKEFLISKNLEAVLEMVDQKLKVKSTLIQNRLKKDSQRNALTGKAADADYQTEYTDQANSYIQIKYRREMTRQLNDPKYNDCVVRKSLLERRKDQFKNSIQFKQEEKTKKEKKPCTHHKNPPTPKIKVVKSQPCLSENSSDCD